MGSESTQFKLGNPGRPAGTGRNALLKQWCQDKGIDILIGIVEGTTRIPKTVVSFGKTIDIEVHPDPLLRFEALKLALAYGLGRPIMPFLVDDRTRNPEDSRRRAAEVLKMIQELESNANSGGETGVDRTSVGNRAA